MKRLLRPNVLIPLIFGAALVAALQNESSLDHGRRSRSGHGLRRGAPDERGGRTRER